MCLRNAELILEKTTGEFYKSHGSERFLKFVSPVEKHLHCEATQRNILRLENQDKNYIVN